MLQSIRNLLGLARRAWSGGGDGHGLGELRRGVVIHDPAASGPRDLDDPFQDPEVQERAARVIAQAAKPRAKAAEKSATNR